MKKKAKKEHKKNFNTVKNADSQWNRSSYSNPPNRKNMVPDDENAFQRIAGDTDEPDIKLRLKDVYLDTFKETDPEEEKDETKKNLHLGSYFDEFLEEEGIDVGEEEDEGEEE